MADAGESPKSKIQAAEEAVSLALASRWQEALAVNDDLMERFGPDEETCNRRGKALLELGRLEEAEGAYQATLEVNPGNQIARRQLAKLAERRAAAAEVAPIKASVDVALFTDEPGKTAITKLLLKDGVEPASVAPGDPIDVTVGEDQVAVRSLRGVELGAIEPRLSQRILKLSKSGNRYAGAVTHVEPGGIQVILREVYQAPELAGTNSFPVRKAREASYRPYTKEAVIPRDEEPPSSGDEDEEPMNPQRERVPSGLEEGFEEFDETAEEPVAEADDDEEEEGY